MVAYDRVLPSHNELHEKYKDAINTDIEAMVFEAKTRGERLCHPNQVDVGKAVAETIRSNPNVLFQIVCAATQAGKTGCMLSIVRQLTKKTPVPVNPKHIYVITGLSDNQWLSQTRDRMPSYIRSDNVIHRGHFKIVGKRIVGQKDVLLFIDEVHIANKEEMSLDKLMQELCLKDAQTMCGRNINIVLFTATPNKLISDIQTQTWSNKQPRWKKHVLRTSENYVGVEDMLKTDRIFPYKDLYINDDPMGPDTQTEEYLSRRREVEPAKDAIRALKDFIISRYNSHDKRYHIIRTPTGQKQDVVMERFKRLCGDVFEYDKCDSTTDDDVLQKIQHRPEKHTFIFIKEHLRCAVTLKPKCNIGVLYERMSRCVCDDVIIQGLLGRCCGYDNDEGMVVFTNIDSVERYIKLLQSNFDDIGDFKYRGSRSKGKSSFVERRTWSNEINLPSPNAVKAKNISSRRYIIFATQKEAIQYAKETFGIRKNLQQKATNTLCDAEGKNPTKDYLLKRWWGLDEKSPMRKAPLYPDGCMIWWDAKYLPDKSK